MSRVQWIVFFWVIEYRLPSRGFNWPVVNYTVVPDTISNIQQLNVLYEM